MFLSLFQFEDSFLVRPSSGKAAPASHFHPAQKWLDIKFRALSGEVAPDWPRSYIASRSRICALLQQQHFEQFVSIQADCASLLSSAGV